MKSKLIVILLLCVFALLAVSSMSQKSATCDEIAHHIPAGYSYLKMWDFRLNPSNPPLSRYLMAVPLTFLNLKAPFDDNVWKEADSPGFGQKFFFEYNFGKARKMIFLSRIPMVLVGMLGGLLTFLFASRLYSKKAGVLALFLYCFSPNIIAHAHLATTDITAACFMLFAVYAFWRFVKAQNIKSFIIAGTALGLAQLSKYTAVILYPTFLLLAVIEYLYSKFHCHPERSEGSREAVILSEMKDPDMQDSSASPQNDASLFIKVFLIFVLSVVVLWAGYGFRMKPFLKEANRPQEKIELVSKAGKRFVSGWNDKMAQGTEKFLREVPLPLTTYITGLFGVIKHGQEGHRMFFMGRWSEFGNPFYYLTAIMIKTPLSILLLSLMAIFISIKKGIKRDELFVLAPMAILLLTASFNKLQLGLRYILPFYPLLIIFASKVILTSCHSRLCENPSFVTPRRCTRGLSSFGLLRGVTKVLFSLRGLTNFFKNHWQKLGILVLCIFLIFLNLLIWPDYLAYFNVLCGGPQKGWKVLRDSNIDWGQDLPALAKYLKENGINEVVLSYFGEDNPALYGIKHRKFSIEELAKPGELVYAISVNYIDSVDWAKQYKPTAKAGYSIFIYDLRDLIKELI
ncbi:MAG: glycosyltransferase family 39 protein [Candidatus Omnitrophota bacterium]